MNNYKFLDVGCKIGGSFSVAKKFGFDRKQGMGVDINEENLKKFNDAGYKGIYANATDLPFEDNSFELVIFSHVLEHLPNEELGKKAFDECFRVSSKYFFMALPFFDEDDYINSLGLKTFYSDWSGHTNKVHLKFILENYLKNLNYELSYIKKLTDSSFPEIIPINAPKDSLDYNPKLHGHKKHIKFNRDIWREYSILIKKTK